MKIFAQRSRGQALVESVLIIPVIVILISGIFFFARVLLTKQQLVVAARYGTDMISYTKMGESDIQEELTEYLCGKDVKGRRLAPDRLRFTIHKDIFPVIDTIDKLDQLRKIKNLFCQPLDHTSYVEIYYEFRVPMLLSAWERFIPGKPLPDTLTIGARSEVLAGTGSR